MPKDAIALAPIKAEILAHLEAIAAPYRGAYDDGLIELAYTAPGEFAPNRAKLFGLDELQEAAEFAASNNARGSNFYIGAALRSPEADPNRRADLAGLYAAAFAVVEADEDVDAVTERITSKDGDIRAIPKVKVRTGTKPHKRMHYWIKLQEICDNFDELADGLAATVANIGGDPKVKDSARIMRLGGTVNHISKSKLEKGYVSEVCRVSIADDSNVVPVSLERLAAAPAMEGWQGGRDGAAGATGAMGEIIRDANGKVTDGREAYWMQLVFKRISDDLEELGRDPEAQDVFDACFKTFVQGIVGNTRWTTSFGKKRLMHRVQNTLKRLKTGALARKGLYSRETEANKEQAIAKQAEYHSPFGGMEADDIPHGFRMRKYGIEMRVESKDGEQIDWHWICSPIRVVSLPRSHSGDDWGRLIELIDPDGNTKQWAMPAELLAADGAEMRRELMRLGVEIAYEARKRQAFQNLLVSWRPEKRSIVTQKLGWADASCTAFALGNGKTLGDEDVVYQSPYAQTAAASMHAKGTLEGWKSEVVPLLQGNPILVFSACMAFGGPLLEMTGVQGGGVNLRGESSKGKTTALEVATSVWGAKSAVQTWRATDNGLEGIACAFNSTLLCLDEMGQVNPKVAGAAAYMMANGKGKSRADRGGRARPAAEWSLLFLSSGEISLADKMTETKERPAAGQQIRILDIAATNQTHGLFDNIHGLEGGHEFSAALRVAVDKNYGTAGPEFIKCILRDKENISGTVSKISSILEERAKKEGLFKGKKPDGQVLRVIQRLGVILAGGVIAYRAGIFPIDQEEMLKSTLVILKLWIEGRGGVGGQEQREAVERTRAFLLTQLSRFEKKVPEYCEKPTVHNRAGWVDDDHFHVIPEAWAEIHSGSGAAEAARAVRDAGFLVMQGKNMKFPIPPTLSENRVLTYRIEKKIVEEQDGGSNDA